MISRVVATEQQLTIFDVLPMELFNVGDIVMVIVNVAEKAVDDFYYLKKFEGVTGKVVKLLNKQQYEVLFASINEVGIFRHSELIEGSVSDAGAIC